MVLPRFQEIRRFSDCRRDTCQLEQPGIVEIEMATRAAQDAIGLGGYLKRPLIGNRKEGNKAPKLSALKPSTLINTSSSTL